MSTIQPAERATTFVSDADATLEAFVEAHYPRLVRLAGLVCGDASEAQDAVQAGLERAWRQRTRLREPERLAGWLDRIVVNEAIRTSRKRRTWVGRFFAPVRQIDVDIVDLRPATTPDDGWLDLRAAFDRLTPDQRAVIALHLYRGYSVAETAEIVGVPLETVRSRLRVARDRLRSTLGEVAR